MTDVIQMAQDKRSRLMSEIETKMAEVERLDNFIMFGSKLKSEAKSDDSGDDDHEISHAAE